MKHRLAYLILFIVIASNLYGSTLSKCFKAMSGWFSSQRTETTKQIVLSDSQGENRTFSVLAVSEEQTPEAEERNALKVIGPHIYLLPVEILGDVFSFLGDSKSILSISHVCKKFRFSADVAIRYALATHAQAQIALLLRDLMPKRSLSFSFYTALNTAENKMFFFYVICGTNFNFFRTNFESYLSIETVQQFGVRWPIVKIYLALPGMRRKCVFCLNLNEEKHFEQFESYANAGWIAAQNIIVGRFNKKNPDDFKRLEVFARRGWIKAQQRLINVLNINQVEGLLQLEQYAHLGWIDAQYHFVKALDERNPQYKEKLAEYANAYWPEAQKRAVRSLKTSKTEERCQLEKYAHMGCPEARRKIVRSYDKKNTQDRFQLQQYAAKGWSEAQLFLLEELNLKRDNDLQQMSDYAILGWREAQLKLFKEAFYLLKNNYIDLVCFFNLLKAARDIYEKEQHVTGAQTKVRPVLKTTTARLFDENQRFCAENEMLRKRVQLLEAQLNGGLFLDHDAGDT